MKNRKNRLLSAAVIAAMLCSLASPGFASAETRTDVFNAAEKKAEMTEEKGLAYDGYIFKLKDGTMSTFSARSADGIDNVAYADKTFTADSTDNIEEFVPEECI